MIDPSQQFVSWWGHLKTEKTTLVEKCWRKIMGFEKLQKPLHLSHFIAEDPHIQSVIFWLQRGTKKTDSGIDGQKTWSTFILFFDKDLFSFKIIKPKTKPIKNCWQTFLASYMSVKSPGNTGSSCLCIMVCKSLVISLLKAVCKSPTIASYKNLQKAVLKLIQQFHF